jgi:heme exporter protein B
VKATLRAAARIAWKDLRIEARTGEVVIVTGLFAFLVTILASISFYIDPNNARLVAPGVLWIAVAFAGVLAMGRSWARERDHDVMRGLLLSPMPRAAIYLGKAAGTLLFLCIVEIILVPLVGVLFQLDLLPVLPEIALLLFLGTLGFIAAGTLFAAMGVRTTARDIALSVILFPLVAPALLAGVVATRELLVGTAADTWGWVRVLAAFDVIFLAAGIVLFEPLSSD